MSDSVPTSTTGEKANKQKSRKTVAETIKMDHPASQQLKGKRQRGQVQRYQSENTKKSKKTD